MISKLPLINVVVFNIFIYAEQTDMFARFAANVLLYRLFV